jgi:hypothetical protein
MPLIPPQIERLVKEVAQDHFRELVGLECSSLISLCGEVDACLGSISQ